VPRAGCIQVPSDIGFNMKHILHALFPSLLLLVNVVILTLHRLKLFVMALLCVAVLSD
jgi:hypothetical protein